MIQNVDQDALDELVQTYAAEYAPEELDAEAVLLAAWRDCGGTGGLAEVHAWARSSVERDGHWPTTLRCLSASGWKREDPHAWRGGDTNWLRGVAPDPGMPGGPPAPRDPL